MNDDERAIRDLVATWLAATKAGDLSTVLNLMTDDMIFMVCGQEPFGKEEFAARTAAMAGAEFEGVSEIAEVQVMGDWAYLRNHLTITMTPPGGQPARRSGYTLTILRKDAGTWRLVRDANLVTAES